MFCCLRNERSKSNLWFRFVWVTGAVSRMRIRESMIVLKRKYANKKRTKQKGNSWTSCQHAGLGQWMEWVRSFQRFSGTLSEYEKSMTLAPVICEATIHFETRQLQALPPRGILNNHLRPLHLRGCPSHLVRS